MFVLVNCAGGVGGLPSKGETGWEAVEDVEPEKFRRLYAINVEGVLNTVAAVAPGMKAACSGKIVNIEDMQAHTLDSHCSTKTVPVRYALEMNLGWFRERGIKAGDVLRGFDRLPAAR